MKEQTGAAWGLQQQKQGRKMGRGDAEQHKDETVWTNEEWRGNTGLNTQGWLTNETQVHKERKGGSGKWKVTHDDINYKIKQETLTKKPQTMTCWCCSGGQRLDTFQSFQVFKYCIFILYITFFLSHLSLFVNVTNKPWNILNTPTLHLGIEVESRANRTGSDIEVDWSKLQSLCLRLWQMQPLPLSLKTDHLSPKKEPMWSCD